MKRWLFNIAAILSLLLLLATCFLWVRGHWRMDMLSNNSAAQPGDPDSIRVTTLSSTINQVNFIRSGSDGPGGPWGSYGVTAGDGCWHLVTIGASWHVFDEYSFSHLGFAWGSYGHAFSKANPLKQDFQWFVWIPNWFLAILFSVAPVLWLRSHWNAQRRYRLAHNLCLTCGYDLRASPEICPECGAVR